MTTIKIKRGLNANVAGLTLQAGELALVTDTGKLYAGDGTTKVLINPDQGTATQADKLTTARTISLTTDVTGSASFDGSANASISATLASSGVTAGTYTKITVDAKGRATVGASATASDVGLGNVTNESKSTMFASAALTGTPTAPTASSATNTTQIATTAYVKAQNYISTSDTIDGGTF